MNTIKLKSILKFWQEIVFIIATGIYFFGMTMNIPAVFHQGINIIFYALFGLLIICLIGQFYWKNLYVGICLAIVLGLGSGYMFLAVLSDLAKISKIEEDNTSAIVGLNFGLLLFIGLTVAAISMPVKYMKYKYHEL